MVCANGPLLASAAQPRSLEHYDINIHTSPTSLYDHTSLLASFTRLFLVTIAATTSYTPLTRTVGATSIITAVLKPARA